MGLTGTRTYVGFGFGAIQAGLFLYEAFQSGRFRRLVVAEIVPDIVAEIRRAGGIYSLNIAPADRVETARVGPVEIYNLTVAGDREALAAAIAEAEEIGTAIPSVEFYSVGGPSALHRTLAAGLARKAAGGGPRAVVYAAENDNAAAEKLEELVLKVTPPSARDGLRANVRFLNTVIGKMSGFAPDPARSGLATITPESSRAFLVEAFHRILISKVRFDPPFERGIGVFVEKENLLPFEEAKLFGHNATHALAAYLGRLLGVAHIAELRNIPGMLPFLRAAFLEESGAALVRKHNGMDPLFTPEGYREYADDLLARMMNPFLMDTIARVGRDPRRKLGWNDRLIGTMRLARSQGIVARRYAVGAAAALPLVSRPDDPLAAQIVPIWEPDRPDRAEQDAMLWEVEQGRRFLDRWRAAGYPNLHEFFAAEA